MIPEGYFLYEKLANGNLIMAFDHSQLFKDAPEKFEYDGVEYKRGMLAVNNNAYYAGLREYEVLQYFKPRMKADYSTTTIIFNFHYQELSCASNFRYAAMEANGDLYVFANKPVLCTDGFTWEDPMCGEFRLLASFNKGNVKWEESLIEI
jgi:hypothetical protein